MYVRIGAAIPFSSIDALEVSDTAISALLHKSPHTLYLHSYIASVILYNLCFRFPFRVLSSLKKEIDDICHHNNTDLIGC